MKSGFSDPIAVKSQRPQDKPENGKNSPWNFSCPQYDQRSSNFVNAGQHQGVGHRTPVGREGNPKMDAPTLPRGKSKTMRDDQRG